MFLKFPVGAMVSTVASVIITFGGHHFIETSFSAIIGDIIVLDACIFFRPRSAEARFHLIIFWKFFLPVKVDIFFKGSKILETVSEIVQSDLIIFDKADHLLIIRGIEYSHGGAPCL